MVNPAKRPPSPKLLIIHEINIVATATDTVVPVINYVGIGVAIVGLLLPLLIMLWLQNVERIREGGQ